MTSCGNVIQLALLAYSQGLTSSRAIDWACERNVQFIAIGGDAQSSGVGRARVGCAAVRWQGGDDAAGSPAREEEQRRQRAAARLNRVRSTSTQQARAVVNTNRNVHAMLPTVTSGQLRLPG
jgi:hypothetical protein